MTAPSNQRPTQSRGVTVARKGAPIDASVLPGFVATDGGVFTFGDAPFQGSEGDRRRTYLRLVPGVLSSLTAPRLDSAERVVFVCTHNSARSQLAAAMWNDTSPIPVLPGEEQELLEVQGYQSFDIGASVHGNIGGFGYHAGRWKARPTLVQKVGPAQGCETMELPAVALEALDEESLVRILKEPKNALTKQYAKLFDLEEVKISFEESALRAIATKALKRGTGARGLRAILEETLNDVMFDLPSRDDVVEVKVTEASILNGTAPLLELSPKRQKKEA